MIIEFNNNTRTAIKYSLLENIDNVIWYEEDINSDVYNHIASKLLFIDDYVRDFIKQEILRSIYWRLVEDLFHVVPKDPVAEKFYIDVGFHLDI